MPSLRHKRSHLSLISYDLDQTYAIPYAVHKFWTLIVEGLRVLKIRFGEAAVHVFRQADMLNEKKH